MLIKNGSINNFLLFRKKKYCSMTIKRVITDEIQIHVIDACFVYCDNGLLSIISL